MRHGLRDGGPVGIGFATIDANCDVGRVAKTKPETLALL
jgi:hypothetical protein